METCTLGRLARRIGMARSSLLHYEKLGLLKPAGRSAGGYRLYGGEELDRLAAIRGFRDAGLPLTAIRALLSEKASDPTQLLEQRLIFLNRELTRLRAQQMQLAQLLASPALRTQGRSWTRDEWVEILRCAGFSDTDMDDWHAGFEADDAPAHAEFLRSLGLAETDIARIRQESQQRRAGIQTSEEGSK